jgi:hypothetical protein
LQGRRQVELERVSFRASIGQHRAYRALAESN